MNITHFSGTTPSTTTFLSQKDDFITLVTFKPPPVVFYRGNTVEKLRHQ